MNNTASSDGWEQERSVHYRLFHSEHEHCTCSTSFTIPVAWRNILYIHILSSLEEELLLLFIRNPTTFKLHILPAQQILHFYFFVQNAKAIHQQTSFDVHKKHYFTEKRLVKLHYFSLKLIIGNRWKRFFKDPFLFLFLSKKLQGTFFIHIKNLNQHNIWVLSIAIANFSRDV